MERGDFKDDLDDAIFSMEPETLSGVLEDETHLRIVRVRARSVQK